MRTAYQPKVCQSILLGHYAIGGGRLLFLFMIDSKITIFY